MLNWLLSWFVTIDQKSSGPARNCPHENVKAFVENKPADMIIISELEVREARNKLHKVGCVEKSDYYTSPLMKELNNVFKMNYKTFLEHKRNSSITH